MKNRLIARQHPRVPFLLVLAVSALLLLVKADYTHALTCTPATCPQIAGGLSAAVGIAVDESRNQAYFVEYTTGALKRINLPPRCGIAGAPACAGTIATVATGFSHPEDVQIDMDHGLAYVTTRDDPGTSGALWKVVLSTGAKSLVTFNLGGPQQLFLDVLHNTAYTVGYNDGRLRRIDLTTGVKTPVFTGLGHPVGLVLTNDRKFAYVTEQTAPARISKIDLALKTKTTVITGLTAPFFLVWSDPSQNTLYVTERNPGNKVSRVDITPAAKNDAITNLPLNPSGIAVRSAGSPVYITTNSALVKVDLLTEFTGPVFMGVGHVPADKIVDGYATTDPGYYYQVKHSPFGGTPNFFGNLVNFRSLGATHYEVLVSKDGGPPSELGLSWNTYKWNTTTLKNDLVAIAPEPGTTKYQIRLEADGTYHAELWYPPFLFMRWPSGENGLYTFSVKIYRKVGAVYNDITGLLPAGLNSLTLLVDNSPATVQLLNICQKGVAGAAGDPCAPDKEVKPCDIVGGALATNSYYFKVTAYDANHHLLNYWLSALWGENKSETIYSDSYSNHADAEGPYLWSGVSNFIVPRDAPGSAGSPATWAAKCNCAHTFYLGSWKRTIDGYNYLLYGDYHKSVTINNTGVTCGMGACGFICP